MVKSVGIVKKDKTKLRLNPTTMIQFPLDAFVVVAPAALLLLLLLLSGNCSFTFILADNLPNHNSHTKERSVTGFEHITPYQ